MNDNKFVTVPVEQLQQWAKNLHYSGWLWMAKEMQAFIAAAPALVSSETVDAKQTQSTAHDFVSCPECDGKGRLVLETITFPYHMMQPPEDITETCGMCHGICRIAVVHPVVQEPAQVSEIAKDLRELVDLTTWQQEVVKHAADALEASTAQPPKGQEISIDVSTGEADSGHRVFAVLTGEVNGDTWLAEETSRNFASTAQPDSEREAFAQHWACCGFVPEGANPDHIYAAMRSAWMARAALTASSEASAPQDAQELHQVTIGGDGFFAGLKLNVDPSLPPDMVEMRGANRMRLNLTTGEISELTAITTAQPAEKPEGKAEQPDSEWGA